MQNRPPLAVSDSYQVTHDHILTVGADNGIFANDSDPDGDPFTAVNVTLPVYGTLLLYASGAFTYTPQAGYVGGDSFSYQLTDSFGVSSRATVSLNVTNTPPTAPPSSYQVLHDNDLFVSSAQGVLAQASDADGDSFTPALLTGTAHGTLTFRANGSFHYRPDAGYVGADGFSFILSDGVSVSAPIAVSLQVTDQAPQAAADSYSVQHDQVLVVSATQGVLANDSDPDGDRLTVSLVPDRARLMAACSSRTRERSCTPPTPASRGPIASATRSATGRS